ncbi:MAG TPA: protease pro-enzyme activation domain-containing protein [Verrucomicrobiae bacterium]
MALAICGAAAISGLAAGTGTVTLHGHIPAAISALKLQPKGELPATNQLTLAIGLPLHNTQEMSNLLARMYDPSTTDYHQYLTPDQFIAKFGPTEQDYTSVSNFAKINGLTIIGQHRSRMLLDVSGKVSDVENAFHVKMYAYRHPTENRDFYAPDSDPSVPASLPVLHVSGLDNYSVPKQMLHPEPLNSKSGASPHTGSGPTGAYIGNDFRNAYVPGTTLTGLGQSVGLVEFDGFYASDIAAYENLIGLTGTAPRLIIVPVDGGIGTPGFNSDEVSLDIEMVLSMSPGVSAIYVYETPPNTSLWVDMLSRMADDDLSSQLSSSWGGGEQPNPSAELIFEQMALQGQSFFQASGDSCAYNNANNPIPFPSDSPHITLVGGTTLTMTGNAASYASETVWNWGTEFGIDGEGSSGGISSLYSIPSWQTNINMTARGGSQTARNVPDVALTGDNIWVIFGGGQSGSFGGTSCAAPLWAAFTALVNQQGAGFAKAPVGFLNPALYSIANGANYATDFHDVTTGNNEWSGSPNAFAAHVNYDLATGLGSPNGTNMINALASATNALTHLSPPVSPYGTTLAKLNGSNPNGNWDLFIVNDSAGDSGEITNGWSITLSLADPVGYAADNYLTMTGSTNLVATNSYGSYILTVTNYGPSTSSNVVVADTLPFGLTVISTNATAGTVNRVGVALTWTLGTLTNSAGGQLTITVQPQTSGSFLNVATVGANTPDPNSDDDSAFWTINSAGGIPAPVLSSVLSGGNSGPFEFYVGVSAGETNVVQGTTNLITGPWIPLITNNGTGPFTFTNTYITNSTVFFRDVIQP